MEVRRVQRDYPLPIEHFDKSLFEPREFFFLRFFAQLSQPLLDLLQCLFQLLSRFLLLSCGSFRIFFPFPIS